METVLIFSSSSKSGLGTVFGDLYLVFFIRRVIIQVQSFMIKCVSFGWVSFVQGISCRLCIAFYLYNPLLFNVHDIARYTAWGWTSNFFAIYLLFRSAFTKRLKRGVCVGGGKGLVGLVNWSRIKMNMFQDLILFVIVRISLSLLSVYDYRLWDFIISLAPQLGITFHLSWRKRKVTIIASRCYHYGISQTCAKMQLIYGCKRENEIYLSKL